MRLTKELMKKTRDALEDSLEEIVEELIDEREPLEAVTSSSVMKLHKKFFPYRPDGERPYLAAAALKEVILYTVMRHIHDGMVS